MSSNAAPSPGFQPRLEALRGLAALTVACGHSLVMFAMSDCEKHTHYVLSAIINGHAAVLIFFALSGYVLGLGLHRRAQALWPGALIFCVRRFLRIWPAVAVSVLMIAFAAWLHAAPESRPAANPTWHPLFFGGYDQPLNAGVVLKNAFIRSTSLNQVMWTLRIEIACSVCLPFMHALCLRLTRRGKIAFGFVIALLPLAPAPGSLGPLLIFYLGYLLSGSGTWDWPRFFSRWKHMAWLAWPTLLGAYQITALTDSPAAVKYAASLADTIAAAFIVGRIAHGAESRWLRVFDLGFSRLLGRLSYSFYLVHSPVLFFALEPLWRILPGPLPAGLPLPAGFVVWIVTTAIALPISWLLYKGVEVPSIALGRMLGPRKHAKATP